MSSKEDDMRRVLTYGVCALALLAASYVGNVQATPQSPGFSGSTYARGLLQGDIEIANHVLRVFGDSTPQQDLWLSLQKTKGPSELYVQNNTWQPGADTGWHSHPGHSLIIVTEGEVTNYDAHDPSCTPRKYGVGVVFVDPGGDHAHMVRNEGTVIARTVAVQVIPAGAARRIDASAPAPGTCPF
jgi:quercetin dioxygenase-like cupin family protein